MYRQGGNVVNKRDKGGGVTIIIMKRGRGGKKRAFYSPDAGLR